MRKTVHVAPAEPRTVNQRGMVQPVAKQMRMPVGQGIEQAEIGQHAGTDNECRLIFLPAGQFFFQLMQLRTITGNQP